ncbi:hypothetical protein [Psychrobacter sp. FME5]|uniref:hypothetical protein n=1 Tax=Psychrobacter sp. FME5 TaxID=2487706 RepID=UPI00178850AE|nr:hypothetical protein [Psychrobacter sp. FME5]MBE0444518.1 hypothetical protein [Psychrobacter sp. FME5]MDN5802352.1 hypothetical protein [Psychrobacter sp.]
MSKNSNGTTGPSDPFKVLRISRREFTVHFRQPNDMAGRYGFDYPRDADRYPIEEVTEPTTGKRTHKALFIGNISNFKDIYLKDAMYSPSLHKYNYLPAWLVIFPYTTNSVYRGGSSMHKGGVKLDIELQQLIGDTSKLSASKYTKLEFVSSNPSKLTVSPSSISIKDFINRGHKTTIVDNANKKTRKDYILKRAVLVKGVKNQLLSKHESIAVYAISANSKDLVGELMVHKNNQTYKADLVLVPTKTSTGINKKSLESIEWYLKYKSFNQALIRAEIKTEEHFDLNKFDADTHIKSYIRHAKTNSHTPESVSDGIMRAYDKYGLRKHKDKKGNTLSINQKGHKKTYIFLLDFDVKDLYGKAPADFSTGQFATGNVALVLKSGLDDYETLVHEVAHSLGVPHVFEPNLANQYKFYQGFSDKVMDYKWKLGTRDDNPNSLISFTKYQWYLMQKDPSVYKL